MCGPARIAFKRIENDLSELLKSCEGSGECIKNEMHENPNPFPGFMGMKETMDMIDMYGQPGHKEGSIGMMGQIQTDPDAGRNEATKQKWKCMTITFKIHLLPVLSQNRAFLKASPWLCLSGQEVLFPL